MKILVNKLDNGGYEVLQVPEDGPAHPAKKEHVINVLELEESLLRHGFSEAEVAQVVAQIERQPSVSITRK
jgi:hypothetical protein